MFNTSQKSLILFMILIFSMFSFAQDAAVEKLANDYITNKVRSLSSEQIELFKREYSKISSADMKSDYDKKSRKRAILRAMLKSKSPEVHDLVHDQFELAASEHEVLDYLREKGKETDLPNISSLFSHSSDSVRKSAYETIMVISRRVYLPKGEDSKFDEVAKCMPKFESVPLSEKTKKTVKDIHLIFELLGARNNAPTSREVVERLSVEKAAELKKSFEQIIR